MKKRLNGKSLLLLFIVLAAASCFWAGFRIRGSVKVKPIRNTPAPEVICYRQDDPRWAGDFLGSSTFTMQSSGCLTTCISSLMLLEEAAGYKTPGALNQFFSERQVYDAQGNIQWGMLEQVLGLRFLRKNSGEMEPGDLEQLLTEGVYPIVRVRMRGLGNVHYVLVVKSEEGEFWCMNPLNEKEELVPLSDFGNRIYGIRYILDEGQ